MQADDLQHEPLQPDVSTSMIQQALYNRREAGLGYSKGQWVALLTELHPEKPNWRNVIFTDNVLAKIGNHCGLFFMPRHFWRGIWPEVKCTRKDCWKGRCGHTLPRIVSSL